MTRWASAVASRSSTRVGVGRMVSGRFSSVNASWRLLTHGNTVIFDWLAQKACDFPHRGAPVNPDHSFVSAIWRYPARDRILRFARDVQDLPRCAGFTTPLTERPTRVLFCEPFSDTPAGRAGAWRESVGGPERNACNMDDLSRSASQRDPAKQVLRSASRRVLVGRERASRHSRKAALHVRGNPVVFPSGRIADRRKGG